jgi:hypothetical protein
MLNILSLLIAVSQRCTSYLNPPKLNRIETELVFYEKFYFHFKASAFKHHDAPAHNTGLETLMLAQ